MTVYINNTPVAVPAGCCDLGYLLSLQGITGNGQAVAVNNMVIPRSSWSGTMLYDGMNITVVRAVCGG